MVVEGHTEQYLVEQLAELLERHLSDGPKPKRELQRLSRSLGFSDTCLDRAKRRKRIRHTGNRGRGSVTLWSLPGDEYSTEPAGMPIGKATQTRSKSGTSRPAKPRRPRRPSICRQSRSSPRKKHVPPLPSIPFGHEARSASPAKPSASPGPYRPRKPTLLTDRFGFDYTTLVSPLSPGGVHPRIDMLFDALSSALCPWYSYELRATGTPEPSYSDTKRFYRWCAYSVACHPHDREDRSLPKLTIRAHPADRAQGAFRISITTPNSDLLHMDRVREIVSAITTATISFFPFSSPDHFFRVQYLEPAYDQDLTQADFWTLLPEIHVPYLRAGGVDLWHHQEYVQWGRRTGSRFAAMYTKCQELLTFLRIECKLRRKRLQQLNVRWFDDLFRVDLAPLFHVRLPEPMQARLLHRIGEFEQMLRGSASAPASSRSPEYKCVPVAAVPIPAGPYVGAVRARLIDTQLPRLIDNQLERFWMRRAFTKADRIRFVGLASSPSAARVLSALEADPLDICNATHVKAALQRHVMLLSAATNTTSDGDDWCVFTVLLDAALQAKEAMKRYRLAPASPAGPVMPIAVTEYLSLVHHAVYTTTCAALMAA